MWRTKSMQNNYSGHRCCSNLQFLCLRHCHWHSKHFSQHFGNCKCCLWSSLSYCHSSPIRRNDLDKRYWRSRYLVLDWFCHLKWLRILLDCFLHVWIYIWVKYCTCWFSELFITNSRIANFIQSSSNKYQFCSDHHFYFESYTWWWNDRKVYLYS